MKKILSEETRIKNNIRSKEWQTKNSIRFKKKLRDYQKRIRMTVLEAYGKKCSCCGESTYEFLVLDHKNNDGNIERKTNGRSGQGSYILAIRENFPGRYQILCYNCNMAKAIYKVCPHKR